MVAPNDHVTKYQIIDLENQVSTLSGEVGHLSRELKRAIYERDQLKSQVAQANKMVENIKGDYAGSSQTADDLRKKVNRLTDERDRSLELKAQAWERIKDLNLVVDSNKERLEVMSQALHREQQRVARLEKVNKEIDDVKEVLSQYKARDVRLKHFTLQLSKALKALEEEL